ncbi:MAG TPA: glycosyltransferase family 2 protein [Burkholderiales bacterium]|nr:glycosyltransferase family 2 protein [Burkholderiales bacterium]
MKTAVIVTTYNRPDALALVLDGYLAQNSLDFELIVADDGSTDDTRRLVVDYAKRAPFPLKHVWHEDRGFRAAAIRNRAVASTAADYLLFTDGDCIPSRAFVARHRVLAEPGWFVAGNRVLLSRAFTARVIAEHLPLHAWTAGDWLAAWARRDINRLLPLIALPDAGYRKLSPQRWAGVKTCNLALWRADFERVNGLDESYSGWGLEDSDLVIRLLHAGVKHKSARFAAPLFHLWHPENDRSSLVENRQRLGQVLASNRIAAPLGFDRYR